MTPDLEALRRLAEGATPGPWKRDRNWWITGPGHDWDRVWLADGVTLDNYDRSKEQRVCHVNGPSGAPSNHADADFDYIAAVSPDVLLALIERVERAEAKVSLMTESTERHGAGRCDCMHAPCSHDASCFLDEREAETKRAEAAEKKLAVAREAQTTLTSLLVRSYSTILNHSHGLEPEGLDLAKDIEEALAALGKEEG